MRKPTLPPFLFNSRKLRECLVNAVGLNLNHGETLNSTLLMLAVATALCWTTNAPAEEKPVARPSAESGTELSPSDAKPLRDPTVMSPRFREALKNMSPQANPSNPAGQGNAPPPPAPKMPAIRLLGLISGNGGQASAMLGIGKDQQMYLVTSGVEITFEDADSQGGVVTIEVKTVTRSEVQLLLKPLNRKITLR